MAGCKGFRNAIAKVAILLCGGILTIACQRESAEDFSPNLETVTFRSQLPLKARPLPPWQADATQFLKPLREDALNSGLLPERLGFDEQLWGLAEEPEDRALLLESIDYSLQYLRSSAAAANYRGYPIPGITRDRVLRSVERFRELVATASTPNELQSAIFEEFTLYQSVGKEGLGDVLFTAYFEPVYAASRVRTDEYRYPLYRRPPNLDAWSRPHPTRPELEGTNGLQGEKGPLKGLELFWLRDRLEAYQIHIQGSARLQLTDGSETTVGYSASTRHNYTSIGAELVEDGKLTLEEAKMPAIVAYFEKNPQDLDIYIPRDRSFVFFQENFGTPALGNLQVPVTASRSIATDDTLMPPGGLALIHTDVPFVTPSGSLQNRRVSRFVLNQDTGGAIRGPGRVDYFLGLGPIAGDRAGVMVSEGKLYFLLLKES
ncbi:MAG: MltA domain-containing protein [Cyanobacteriota bacterium]|nr:MltA domain-containing protein [Cyanobacteriota bacterium]